MPGRSTFATIALLVGITALIAGCQDFWAPHYSPPGSATRPSPAQDTAAVLATAAATTAGSPLSPALSAAASILAVIAAAMARSHSSKAHTSACQAGVLFEALQRKEEHREVP